MSCQVSLHLLTLKLYDALETHSQFNLSNALPGDLVVEFIKNFIPKYKGENKEELIKVCELSQWVNQTLKILCRSFFMMIYMIFMRLLLDIICSKFEEHFFRSIKLRDWDLV